MSATVMACGAKLSVRKAGVLFWQSAHLTGSFRPEVPVLPARRGMRRAQREHASIIWATPRFQFRHCPALIAMREYTLTFRNRGWPDLCRHFVFRLRCSPTCAADCLLSGSSGVGGRPLTTVPGGNSLLIYGDSRLCVSVASPVTAGGREV